MRALRFWGNKDIRVDEIEEPQLRPGWVKVKNAWSGICGSGHEFSGTIIEVADDVDDIKIGQKVAVFPVITDPGCSYCERDVFALCDKWGFLGYSGYGGGMAEYVCVDRKFVINIPDSISLEVAALVEPLAVGWHGVGLTKIQQDDVALVLGAGPIGIAVVLALKAKGVNKIVVSEISAARSQHAKVAGALHVVNPLTEDVDALVRTLDDRGAHVVYECAGVQASIDTAVSAVRGLGTIVTIAIYEKPIQLLLNVLNRKSVTMISSSIYTRQEFQEVIDAIAEGKLRNPEAMITARIPLSKSVEDGFEELLRRKDKHVKILVSAGT